ncbi:MAG: DUF1800 domain-containing protein [Cyclobacteriaceae bacterium]|nr:MAG: DUF1800 domain-containing protein [Cyclobacteriaceae bacterium]
MPTSANQKHFYSRAAFGLPVTSQVNTPAESMKRQVELKSVTVIDPDRPEETAGTDTEMIRQKAKKNRSELITLNTAWFNQLTDPQAVVREKMTFFWHDHFACRSRNAFLAQQQINTLRQHALGKFGDLLMAVSKDPAMLQFLNNQQNKKGSPNENFAREVMELFTLGRGNYSEEDIKNAARAFTGWAFNPLNGQFLVRPRQHDEGRKTFRGKSGNFSGEDIIAMILEDRKTAEFITKKIISFFAGEVDSTIVDALSQEFFKSDYDITKLLKSMYTSEWFYDKKYLGNRIKSPVELIAGIQTHTQGTFNNPLNVTYLQKALGQVLLQPPNVSGWPNGKEWIDSSSLTFRMSIPSQLLNNIESPFDAKDDGDVNNDANKANKASKLSYSADLATLAKQFAKATSAETLDAIEDHVLACAATAENKKLVTSWANSSKDDQEFIKKAFIGFMSLPEYQLS